MPKWSAVRKNIFSGYKTATGEVIKLLEIVIPKFVPQLIANLCPVPFES